MNYILVSNWQTLGRSKSLRVRPGSRDFPKGNIERLRLEHANPCATISASNQHGTDPNPNANLTLTPVPIFTRIPVPRSIYNFTSLNMW